MFSITMVAVTFASGQYGPRLIGNFMRDRGNQWSLGILISTFTYSLLILRAVQSPQAADATMFVPQVSIFVALILALVSVFTVIYHVHHVPETISVSNIIASLGRRLIAEVKRLEAQDSYSPVLPQTGPSVDIVMHTAGYVHGIALSRLSDIATNREWIVEILAAPGVFVHPQIPVMRVWGASELCDEERSALRQCVALGQSKTEDQNILFIVEQLVEIVGRAMSPGINDPFTAISCMQWLEAGLAAASANTEGLSIITARNISLSPISFERMLDAGLGSCVPYVCDDALARAELERLLAQLSTQANAENDKAVQQLITKLKTH
ncbi:DUF2254 domain-containing protein [Loktanella sp. S4079]|uniref:DUF2254 domain-containing protein n=1 Tax=Loktanella sp. S4079 TaxID=579483 RepID=UPI0006973623|nr:DUF2254 domain-containing protein [Loktanella sp. S4079]